MVLKIALGPEYLRSVGNTMTLPRPSSMAHRHKPKRVGKAPLVGQPKVFGCALEDYIEVWVYVIRLKSFFQLFVVLN